MAVRLDTTQEFPGSGVTSEQGLARDLVAELEGST